LVVVDLVLVVDLIVVVVVLTVEVVEVVVLLAVFVVLAEAEVGGAEVGGLAMSPTIVILRY
jgi:hypothetical protein